MQTIVVSDVLQARGVAEKLRSAKSERSTAKNPLVFVPLHVPASWHGSKMRQTDSLAKGHETWTQEPDIFGIEVRRLGDMTSKWRKEKKRKETLTPHWKDTFTLQRRLVSYIGDRGERVEDATALA